MSRAVDQMVAPRGGLAGLGSDRGFPSENIGCRLAVSGRIFALL